MNLLVMGLVEPVIAILLGAWFLARDDKQPRAARGHRHPVQRRVDDGTGPEASAGRQCRMRNAECGTAISSLAMRIFKLLALALALGATTSAQAPQFSNARPRLHQTDARRRRADQRARDRRHGRAGARGADASSSKTAVIAAIGRPRHHAGAGRCAPPSTSPASRVMPGLVMVHEHLYYPAGPGVYGQLGDSFIAPLSRRRRDDDAHRRQRERLHGPQHEAAIDRGQKPGPAIDATAPYLNGPNTFIQMRTMKGAGRRAAAGRTTGPTRARRRSRPTCRSRAPSSARRSRRRTSAGSRSPVTSARSPTREAADLGIDNLEHGFLAATDFVADKQPDACPGQGARPADDCRARRERRAVQARSSRSSIDQQRRAHLDADGVRDVHAGTAAAARARGAGAAAARTVRADARAHGETNAQSIYTRLFPKALALERAFARAGGLLDRRHRSHRRRRRRPRLFESAAARAAGRGRASRRSRRIQIGTLNGATYLGRDARIGSIAAGKQADLVVVTGDPSATDRRRPQRRDRLQARRRVRPGEARSSRSAGRVGLW